MSQFTKRVDANDNEGRLIISDSGWSTNSILLGDDYKCAVRFTGVNVAKGATITSAYIKGTSWENSTNDVYLKVGGIDEDNTAILTNDPTGRSETTAKVDWDMTAVTENVEYSSPDIKTIVQEIIDRASWSSGNAMGFFLTDDGSAAYNYYVFNTYSDDSTKAFYLEINYTTSTATNSSRSAKTSGSLGSQSERGAVITSAGINTSRSAKVKGKISTDTSRSAKLEGTGRGNWGMKVSKAGHDVKTVTDIKDLVFTSARGVLGLKELKTYTATTDVSGDINFTAYHNFGYAPITIVTFTSYDSKSVQLPISWASYNAIGGGETLKVTEDVSFSVDSTSINFTVSTETYNLDTTASGVLAGRNYTFGVYYYFNEITHL